MNALFLLTVANIKSFTRDRAALFWTLAFPLIFVVLFGSIFSGGNPIPTSIGFADLDGSPASPQLKSAFASIDGVKLVDGSQDDLLAKMQEGDVSAVIVVPAGYGATVAARRRAGDADGLHGSEPEPADGRDAPARRASSSAWSTRQASGRPPAVVPTFQTIQTVQPELHLVPGPVDPRHVADAGRDLRRDPARRRSPEADPQATPGDAAPALAARRLATSSMRLLIAARPDGDHRRRRVRCSSASRSPGRWLGDRVLRHPRLADVHRARLRDRLVRHDRGGGQRR